MSDRPRLGFLGVGWIGLNRLRSIAAAGHAVIAAVADTSEDAARAAAAEHGAHVVSPAALLTGGDLDGVVIATPSAGHAVQAQAALEAGLAVFCQKPLARTADETADVVNAAASADRLLAVDLSYRHVRAARCVRELVDAGELGDVYAARLVFHNAYGPDKPWFTDPAQSGGGCVIDLATHLIDLALWTLEGKHVRTVASQLFANGRRLDGVDPHGPVEDYATAQIGLADGTAVDIACSWFLHAGMPAEISGTFYGTRGSATVENVGGSFFDFTAALNRGTTREVLVDAPDDWGGRAANEWVERLAAGEDRFDAAAFGLVTLAATIDRIYGS